MTGRDCYDIVFDDGERITCDGEHRWPVWDFTDDGWIHISSATPRLAAKASIGVR